jgi:hypothetical protein
MIGENPVRPSAWVVICEAGESDSFLAETELE